MWGRPDATHGRGDFRVKRLEGAPRLAKPFPGAGGGRGGGRR